MRFPRPKQGEIAKSLIGKVDHVKLAKDYRDLWDKSFSEADLDYLVKLNQSPIGKKFDGAIYQFNKDLEGEVLLMLKEQSGSIALEPEVEPVAKPGTITKLLWKLFPDSKVCKK